LGDALFSPEEHEPRVARSTTVTARDYISPFRFWLVPILVLVAVLLWVTGLGLSYVGQIDPSRYLRGPAVWAVPVAVVLALAVVNAARNVVRQKQSASDSLELAWSDALRADTLRTLWVFESIVCWLAIVLTGIAVLRAIDEPISLSLAGGVVSLAANAGIIALSRLFNYGAGRHYFRYRLWPDLGDVGEIVDDDDNDDESETESIESERHRP
jgi:hypothetical protein